MAIQTNIQVTHGKETIGTIESILLKQASKPIEMANALVKFFNSLAGKDRSGEVIAQVNSGDAVAASSTITFSSMAASDTVTVGTQTFTCESSGATGHNQFNKGGTDTLSAAAFVAVFNGNPTVNQYLVASNAAAVITITCLIPGDIGNNIPTSISGGGSAAHAVLQSGANATTYSAQNTYHLGV